jgi:hypothetical protein
VVLDKDEEGHWVPGRVGVHVALLIQHATRMRQIVTSFVAPLDLLHFSTLFHKRRDFRKRLYVSGSSNTNEYQESSVGLKVASA